MLSPLDQLYLETTSKEDLLAEINDQRRQVTEARGIASELQRKLWAVEAERDKLLVENEQMKKRAHAATSRLSRVRKKHNERVISVVSEIIALIEKGLSNDEIESMGYNRSTIRVQRSRINAIEKAAQSN